MAADHYSIQFLYGGVSVDTISLEVTPCPARDDTLPTLTFRDFTGARSNTRIKVSMEQIDPYLIVKFLDPAGNPMELPQEKINHLEFTIVDKYIPSMIFIPLNEPVRVNSHNEYKLNLCHGYTSTDLKCLSDLHYGRI